MVRIVTRDGFVPVVAAAAQVVQSATTNSYNESGSALIELNRIVCLPVLVATEKNIVANSRKKFAHPAELINLFTYVTTSDVIRASVTLRFLAIELFLPPVVTIRPVLRVVCLCVTSSAYCG